MTKKTERGSDKKRQREGMTKKDREIEREREIKKRRMRDKQR